MGEILELVFHTYRWFDPRRYGSASLANTIDSNHVDLAPIVAHYEDHNSLCVAAKTDRDFIWFSPILPGSPPYAGEISWMTSTTSAAKASWRASHATQVAELMHLVGSPLAKSGLEEDLDRKTRRWVLDGTSEKRVLNLRDYSEGLPGLVWRNFYGPPFIRMFGERLDALPSECRKPLGEDLVLVQPYELPTEAGTEAGMTRERELISLLGPECFYDHERRTLPTRRPVLDSLGQPVH
ncbi:hypothetical protein ACN28E_14265 [Archangium lansingense]|uniref:hypothetical protein n=1 Tax=Archangium lansingense TaxID=2995310 RepID=UPI003B76C87D